MQNRRSTLSSPQKLAMFGAVVRRTLACLLLVPVLLVLPHQEAGAASITLGTYPLQVNVSALGI